MAASSDPINISHFATVASVDPYPHLPRQLVFQVRDYGGAAQAYADGSVTPRRFLDSLSTEFSGILKTADDGQYLFQPDAASVKSLLSQSSPPPLMDAFLRPFAFLAFEFPNLQAAQGALAAAGDAGELHPGGKILADTPYVRGIFGAPSGPVTAWSEREVGQQDYLQPARYGGIDALRAWAQGYKGSGETIYVVESGVWEEHPDFKLAGSLKSVSVPYAGPKPEPQLPHYKQHGTATLGILVATENTSGVRRGIMGISAEARARVALLAPGIGHNTQQVSNMIYEILFGPGSLKAKPGSVVLLETCYMPPNTNIWLPVEVDPAFRSQIQLLLAAHMVVVEPAGNSDTDIDSYLPVSPKDPSVREPTGAILVGASHSKPPPAKTLLSNYSSGGHIQFFSWGENVYTTSVGLAEGSSDPPIPSDYVPAYTHMTGTSAAAAIVAGAAVLVQQKRRSGPAGAFSSAFFLNNLEMIKELIKSATESPEDAPIGRQPDLSKNF